MSLEPTVFARCILVLALVARVAGSVASAALLTLTCSWRGRNSSLGVFARTHSGEKL